MVNLSDIVRFDKLEDRITAQLVATLEHSPNDKVLSKFLKLINFRFIPEKVIFSLQVPERNSIPDALIESGSFMIYVETKLGDSVDSPQIKNHFLGGKGKKLTFIVLCITAGLNEPLGVKEAITDLQAIGESPDIRWLSWRKIYELAKDLAITLSDDKATFLLRNLMETLERENLRGFSSFKKEEFLTAKEAVPALSKTLEKWNQFMEEVTSILEKNSIKKVIFYRNGKANSKVDNITEAYYGFNKEDWEPMQQGSQNGSLAIIDMFFDSAIILIGLRIFKDVIYSSGSNWKDLIQDMKNQDFPQFDINLKTLSRERDITTEELLKLLDETKENREIDYITFYRNSFLWIDENIEALNTVGLAEQIKFFLGILELYRLYNTVA